MRPITEYQDYREYMRDFYAERKRSSYFTWRKFASLAGALSGQAVLLGRNCEKAAKMALWLC
jgi:uncharacterized protein (TIGR02147 family)